VDAALGRLVAGLRQRNIFDATNLIVVSDHGMNSTSGTRVVLLDSLVNIDHLDLVTSTVLVGINPKPAHAAEVEHALLGSHSHMQCWKKENLPKKFHYGHNPRVPAIQCLADDGWMVTTAAAESKRTHAPLGEHGYDNDNPTMRALFVARGPSFKHHVTVPVFDNINIYDLLARLMQIKPQPNDGNAAVTAGMLRDSATAP